MKMYLSALTLLAILVGAEGNALRGASADAKYHPVHRKATRWVPHRQPGAHRHPVSIPQATRHGPSLVSHHHVTTARHGHAMTAHHGAMTQSTHHHHTDPMMGFFDIMIGSMVDQNMAAQKAAKEQQAQAQAQAQQQDQADDDAPPAEDVPAEVHYVWTQEGVDKVNAKGVGGMLGNPVAGADVTAKQEAMAKQYGQWDTAVREGWIEQQKSHADGAAEKSLAHDGGHDDESELFAPPGPQPLEDHNGDDDVALSGKAPGKWDKDELADAYADAMQDMPDIDDDLAKD